jgi:RNA polymerase sigma-B factor
MHVATRALSMETMHFHLCIAESISIHHFTRSVLDIAFVSRYVSHQKGWWIAVVYQGTAEEAQRRRSNAVLLTAYHRRGDRSARTRVIEQNLPLVHSLARRFSRPSDSIDDLVQVGAIGLIKAVDGFRADRGSDLGAYAVPTIVGELRRHLRERRPGLDGGERSAPSPARVTVPLDEESLESTSQLEIERSEARELVRTGLRALSPRERRIVALRFYRDLSQERIAEEVGLSQVQVSRVLASSLAKMRRMLEAA